MPAMQEQTEYKYGFVTPIESESIPKGLTEETVRLISAKKNEPAFLLEFRLKAFRKWQEMEEPDWANLNYPPIDYQDICYYSAPKKKQQRCSTVCGGDHPDTIAIGQTRRRL